MIRNFNLRIMNKILLALICLSLTAVAVWAADHPVLDKDAHLAVQTIAGGKCVSAGWRRVFVHQLPSGQGSRQVGRQHFGGRSAGRGAALAATVAAREVGSRAARSGQSPDKTQEETPSGVR